MGEQLNDQAGSEWPAEELIDTIVRYILDVDGALFVFENVPARVNQATGEQLFSPATVRRIQQIAFSARKPDRIVQANVYDWEQAA